MRRPQVLHYRHCIIVENGWDVFRREFVRGVTDEQASLAYSTITDHNTPREAFSQPNASTLRPSATIPRASSHCTGTLSREPLIASQYGPCSLLACLSISHPPQLSALPLPPLRCCPRNFHHEVTARKGYPYLIVATTILTAFTRASERFPQAF